MSDTDEQQQLTPQLKRAAWGDGPWVDEPDRVEFEHAGLPCLMQRVTRSGHWCGYVAVPPGHPCHGCGYDAAVVEEVEVHGGLTYAARCSGTICHVPKPGTSDDVWWFGFDCAHVLDLVPAHRALDRFLDRTRPDRISHDVYRDQAYVEAETRRLAEQLADVS